MMHMSHPSGFSLTEVNEGLRISHQNESPAASSGDGWGGQAWRRALERAGTAWREVKLILRWCRNSIRVVELGRDHGLVQAPAYLHDGIDMLAAEVPQLQQAPTRAQKDVMISGADRADAGD